MGQEGLEIESGSDGRGFGGSESKAKVRVLYNSTNSSLILKVLTLT